MIKTNITNKTKIGREILERFNNIVIIKVD